MIIRQWLLVRVKAFLSLLLESSDKADKVVNLSLSSQVPSLDRFEVLLTLFTLRFTKEVLKITLIIRISDWKIL